MSTLLASATRKDAHPPFRHRYGTYNELFDDAASTRQRQGLEIALTVGAAIAFLEGDHVRACRLLAWVRARTLDAGHILLSQGAYAIYKNYVRLLRDTLPRKEARRYRDEGAALSDHEAIALALRTDEPTDSPVS